MPKKKPPVPPDPRTAGDVAFAQAILAAALPGCGFDIEQPADEDRIHKKIYRLAAEEIIPSVHIGRRVIFRREALEDWIRDGGSTTHRATIRERAS
jgi:hypothetical protein